MKTIPDNLNHSLASFPPPITHHDEALDRQLGYRPALDGLRGLFFLIILVFHSGVFWKVPGMPFVFVVGGFMSVDSFFVMSGFLITTLLLGEWQRTGRVRLGYFYARRALRLLPALFAVLLACSVYLVWFADANEARWLKNGMLAALFYYANWAAAFGVDIGALIHTWSLALEEQFYLVWPPILVLLLRKGVQRRWLIALLIGAIVLCGLWRWTLFERHVDFGRLVYASDTHADGLLFGCLLALLWDQVRAWRKVTWVAAVAGTLILLDWFLRTDLPDPALYRGGYSLIAMSFALVVLGLLEHPLRPLRLVLENPFIVWCGRASYGLYLWHVPILYWFKTHAGAWNGRTIGFAWLTVFAVCAASYYLIELPCLRLKKHFSVRH